MRELSRLLGFLRPYRRLSILALVMLTALVIMDLAIPRLIQRIIDQGIARHDRGVVIQTSLLMLGISALSTVIAIANNGFSVRVGEPRRYADRGADPEVAATPDGGSNELRDRPPPRSLAGIRRPASSLVSGGSAPSRCRK